MSIATIAEYRVVRQLGAGGIGQVFLVEHPRLPRQDALKLLDGGQPAGGAEAGDRTGRGHRTAYVDRFR